jgi:hypothetical protein
MLRRMGDDAQPIVIPVGNFVVKVRFGELHGELAVVGYSIDINPNRPVAITATGIRSIRHRETINKALRKLPRDTASVRRRAGEGMRLTRRNKYSDRTLTRVAVAYSAAPGGRAAAVATAMNVNPNEARNLIRAARDRGALPPTTERKARGLTLLPDARVSAASSAKAELTIETRS